MRQHVKKIVQLDRQGAELGKFDSIPEASRKTGIPQSSIHEALFGARKKCDAGGFLFVRSTEKINVHSL